MVICNITLVQRYTLTLAWKDKSTERTAFTGGKNMISIFCHKREHSTITHQVKKDCNEQIKWFCCSAAYRLRQCSLTMLKPR